MRTALSEFTGLIVWGFFFATTVYGHIAFKLAAGKCGDYDFAQAFHALNTFWGWTAVAAWMISGFLWVVVLTKNNVLHANSISALRYVLIALAAWLFLRERFQYGHGLGVLLTAAGIWLLTR